MKKIRPVELCNIISKVAVKGGLPVMIWGAPGIGKSQIVRESARELQMEMLDLRLNYYEESDFLGIPMRTERGMEFVKYAKFPKNGSGIWFLDELTHARTSTQGLVFQLINDGRIEDYLVPEGWRHFVAASNLPSHGSISNQMPSGLASRFTGGHYELVPDIDDWSSWALRHGIDDRIISFLQYMERTDEKPWLYRDDGEFLLTPRLWATGVNLAVKELDDDLRSTAIMGMLGEDRGMEFIHYLHLMNEMPDPERIASGDYSWLNRERDISLRYLLVVGLAKLASRDPAKLTGCLKALLHMDNEFAAVGIGMIRRNLGVEALMKNQFMLENSRRFLDLMGAADGQP